MNETGLFVGLTNRAGSSLDPHRRSRGQLVIDAARCRSLAEVDSFLRSIETGDYNGFHLLAAGGDGGVLAVDDGNGVSVSVLGKGRHIVSERSFGASSVSRDGSVARAMEGNPSLDSLESRLGEHLADPFQSICVHMPEVDYGTRSSTILTLGGGPPSLRFAPGPPCVTRWDDRSGLLQDLLD